jgi:hypothetical protein
MPPAAEPETDLSACSGRSGGVSPGGGGVRAAEVRSD